MANMLYNGVELPDINTVWTDKETYTHACIIKLSSAPNDIQLFLFTSVLQAIPSETGEVRIRNIADCSRQRFSFYFDDADRGWIGGKIDDYSAGSIGLEPEIMHWTSADILLSSDNTIYFAASEPVPVGNHTYDRTVFLNGLAMGLCGKGNPTFEGSGKMLYNGVELPDINSVWDKKTYPYAFIVHHDDYGDTYDRYELWLSADEPYMREYSGLHQLMVKGAECYYAADGVWTLKFTYKDEWYAIESQYDNDTCIWSNVDILDLDGSTLSAASDPVPVEDTFAKGYKVGAELRRKRVLPVAYLYNGVRLPDINTVWTDKQTYPYAYVIRTNSTLVPAHLYLCNMPCGYSSSGGYFPSGCTMRSYSLHYLNNAYAWYFGNEKTFTKDTSWTGYGTFHWVSADVLNEDGTVAIYTSDPVPVYK